MSDYFDSSAIVKLVVPEAESAAMAAYARRLQVRARTSELARAEVIRAVWSLGSVLATQARSWLDRLELVPLTLAVLDDAATLDSGGRLRTLDAIHLASALLLPDLDQVVTYDQRMAEAATALGLRAVSPT